MCVFVLSFLVGGFSRHNVKERKYKDWRSDYKNTEACKKRKIDSKNLGNNLWYV